MGSELGAKLNLRVGILGGGQLARMLASSAWQLGLKPRVLTSRASDPAAQLCPDSVYGDAKDPVVLRRFLSQLDFALFENEFVDCERISAAASGLSVRFAPSLDAIYQLQDKIRQKKILEELKILSAPYFVCSKKENLNQWIDATFEKFGGECVLKWAQLGYDGKGTFISDGANSRDAARAFCEKAFKAGVEIFAEKKVAIRRELAVLGCRSSTEFSAYPLVISVQEKGICKLVTGPAASLGVPTSFEGTAQRAARALGDHLGLLGCFAIEFFETEKGELWVNELAPRVHNSGHYTMNADLTSQFENHWRGALGMKLGRTMGFGHGFGMVNLIGPDGVTSSALGQELQMPELPKDLHLYWYGKDEIRGGRKMGHVNGMIENVQNMPKLQAALDEYERKWSGLMRELPKNS